MLPVGQSGHDDLLKGRQHLGKRFWLFWSASGKLGSNVTRCGRLAYRALTEILQIVSDPIN